LAGFLNGSSLRNLLLFGEWQRAPDSRDLRRETVTFPESFTYNSIDTQAILLGAYKSGDTLLIPLANFTKDSAGGEIRIDFERWELPKVDGGGIGSRMTGALPW